MLLHNNKLNWIKVLFFIALALIAVGMAGQAVSLQPFTILQNIYGGIVNHRDQMGTKVKFQVAGFLIVIFVRFVGGIAIPLIQVGWSVRFYLSCICTLIPTLLFLSGCRVYKRNDPKEITPSTTTERVSEVEDTKHIVIRMVPMCLTFIAIGIVLSIGNTYFIEQANRLDRKVGKLKVPIEIFLIIHMYTRSKAESEFEERRARLKSKKYAPVIGVATSVFVCALCCIIAALVETRRLHVIKDHGLLDKPTERIPMRIFWVFPQFILLGIIDGIANGAITCFFNQQSSKSMNKYLSHLTKGVLGLGTTASVLSVHIVGKASERNQNPSWFQPTLNESRFNRYYWMLAALSAVSFGVYLIMSCFYKYKEPPFFEDEE